MISTKIQNIAASDFLTFKNTFKYLYKLDLFFCYFLHNRYLFNLNT